MNDHSDGDADDDKTVDLLVYCNMSMMRTIIRSTW